MNGKASKNSQIMQQLQASVGSDARSVAELESERTATVDLLNTALATELVCVLRYKSHRFAAKGPLGTEMGRMFWEHADEEMDHANWIAERISQLGGKPNYSPVHLSERAHSSYVECVDLFEMAEENVRAEKLAIDFYRELILKLGDKDSTTRRLVEKILAKEEEHADELGVYLVADDTEAPKKTDSESHDRTLGLGRSAEFGGVNFTDRSQTARYNFLSEKI